MKDKINKKHFVTKNHKKRNLTKEEEYSYIKKAQNGDFSALEELVLTNLAFIKKQVGFGLKLTYKSDIDDFIQVGIIGFMESIQRFDISKGFRLKTYGTHYIRKNVYELAQNSNLIRVPKYQWTRHKDKNTGLYEALGIHIQTINTDHDMERSEEEEICVSKRDKKFLDTMLNSMEALDKYCKPVIKGYYIDNKEWKSLAKELNISRDRVRRIKVKSLEYMKFYLKRRNIEFFGDIV